MSPLEWIRLFADFARLVPEIVEEFSKAHPQLTEDEPPPAGRAEIDRDIDDAIDRGDL